MIQSSRDRNRIASLLQHTAQSGEAGAACSVGWTLRTRRADLVAGQTDKVSGRSIIAYVQVGLEGAVVAVRRESTADAIRVGPNHLTVMARHNGEPACTKDDDDESLDDELDN